MQKYFPHHRRQKGQLFFFLLSCLNVLTVSEANAAVAACRSQWYVGGGTA